MCTLALYFKVFDEYPIVVAANRDEHYDRPSSPPAVINTNPKILAGKDLRAGGTWFGANSNGVIAGILNRRTNGDQEPASRSRSRGLLCLDLLGVKNTDEALESLRAHGRETYQPFTVVFADPKRAWAAFNRQGKIESIELTTGLHVFSNTGDFDAQSDKVKRVYGLFAALIPDLRAHRARSDRFVATLRKTLSDHTVGHGPGGDPRDAICVHGEISGTVSSSILFYSRGDNRFHTFYCPGPPCQNPFGESLRITIR